MKRKHIELNLAFFSEERRGQEIDQRLSEIRTELSERGDALTADDVANLTTEVNKLKEERKKLLEENQARKALLDLVANDSGGQGQQSTPISSVTFRNPIGEEPIGGGRYDSPQYLRHFMEFVCRGTPVPDEFQPTDLELRADATTTAGGVSAVIPTTIMSEIIREAKTFGNLYKGVRHLNVKGGAAFPILTLIPEAKWIGENKTSDRQKTEAEKSVTFNYYGLECRISQSLLVSVVTTTEFQLLFTSLSTEAIVKALDLAIIRGTGNGQPLGVLNDTRIPAGNKITLTEDEVSKWGKSGWKGKVFAKMKKSYRSGIFIMSQGTFDTHIDGMEDTTGQPIGRINYGIDGAETYRFGGRTVETVEDEVLPAWEDAEVGDVVAIFMRLRDYAINTNMQMRVVKWFDHDKNEYVNKAILVADGKVLDPHGILLITKGGAASKA